MTAKGYTSFQIQNILDPQIKIDLDSRTIDMALYEALERLGYTIILAEVQE